MSTQYNDNEGNPWTLIIIILVILFAVLFFIAMIGLRPEIRSNTPEDRPLRDDEDLEAEPEPQLYNFGW